MSFLFEAGGQPSHRITGERLAKYNIIVQSAAVVGFALGGYMPVRKAARQFYAEHQHCPPLTRSEALLYHRRRNYRVIHTYMTHGVKSGLQLGLIGASWCLLDASLWQFVPGTAPMFREPVKGAMVGGLMFWAGKGHRLYYAWRGLKLGGTLGMVYGATLQYTLNK
jgi:hypothetical protein